VTIARRSNPLSRAALALLIALSAVAAAHGAESPGAGLIPSGDSRILWIVRPNEERSAFAAVARPAGKKWRWVARDLVGVPTMAAAADGQLHLLFASGAYRMFRIGSPEPMPGPPFPSTPLAVCAATDFGSVPGVSLLAVAAGNAAPTPTASSRATRPTSRPHSRPARAADRIADAARPTRLVRLVIRQKTPTEWREVAAKSHVRLGAGGRVLLAAVGQTVFLLAAGGEERNLLWAWQGGTWRDVPLTDRLARLDPRALVSVEDHLVLVLTEATADGRGRQVHLAKTDSTAGTFSVRSVRKDGAIRTWPAGTNLHVARLRNELALLWAEDGKIRLGSSDLTGKFTPMSDVTVFDKPPTEGRGERLHEHVRWAVMAVVFLLVLVLRPRNRAVFVLPEGLHPAPMPRRIVAAVIDTAPFGMLSAAIFAPGLPATIVDLEEAAATRTLPDAVFYWILLAVGLYTIYATVMEVRYGATIGKMALRLRVVDGEGKRPKPWPVILRNVARMIPLLWVQLLFLLMLFSVFNVARQRLGDVLARTCVIDTRFIPPELPAEEPPRDETSDGPPEKPS